MSLLPKKVINLKRQNTNELQIYNYGKKILDKKIHIF